MSIGIYKITNPKGKIYIGQSTNIEKRWKNYQFKKNPKKQPKLYNSFLKYGVINHKFEIIEECKFEDLNTRERYWQDYYNVLNYNGLNCILTNTEELPKYFSYETKNKISQNKKGLYRIEEHILTQIKNLYENKTPTTKISEITGISVSHIIKILKKENIYKLSNHKPSILQYDLEGNFIKEWDNISLICRELKLKGKNGDIQSCCENKQISAFGYQWMYKNSNILNKINPIKERKRKRSNILQYNLDGDFIKEWKSMSQITISLGFQSNMISSCCRGRIKNYMNYIWKYKEN